MFFLFIIVTSLIVSIFQFLLVLRFKVFRLKNSCTFHLSFTKVFTFLKLTANWSLSNTVLYFFGAVFCIEFVQ